jgi:DNA ligase-1
MINKKEFIEIAAILDYVECNSGRNAKISILEEHKNNEALKTIFTLAYNPYIKFNVARVPIQPDVSEFAAMFYYVDTFVEDLQKLIDRTYTGHAALKHVNYIWSSLPKEFQPYLEKILQKDLKIGISTQTINKVWHNLIPEFKLGLCERWKKVKPIRDLNFPMYAEPKIDGVRVLAFVYPEQQKVEMMARSGIRYDNFKVIEEELLHCNITVNGSPGKDGKSYVLDGEIIDETFIGIMNNARRKYDVNCSEAIFHIWDILDLYEFLNEICTSTQEERKRYLDLMLIPYNGHLKVHPYQTIKKADDIQYFFERFYNAGYEGLILKNPKAQYIYSSGTRRGKAWLKYKIQDYNKETGGGSSIYSVRITGYYPGDPGTRIEHILGGFTYTGVATLNDNTIEINGRVGGGYKDAQREDFWNRKDDLIGTIIDIESQEITTDKKGLHSLRFPVFQRMRPDLVKETHEC